MNVKLLIPIASILSLVCGCGNSDLESAIYCFEKGRLQCSCSQRICRDPETGLPRMEGALHDVDIVSISSSPTDIKDVWTVTINGVCGNIGEIVRKAEYSFKDGKVRFIKHVSTRGPEEFRGASTKTGDGQAVVMAESIKTDRTPQVDTDEYVMNEALRELQAGGGTNSAEAVAAFRDRTSGIFNRAVKRIHPTLNNGVPYKTADVVAKEYPDEDFGKAAAESIRRTEEYVRGMDPMEWLERKGDK